FSYPFASVNATAPGQVDRCWAAGSATAANGTVQSGWGVLTQFTMRTGAQVTFGAGCPGAGGFTPVASTNTLARPGITWTQQVNQAASQRLAMWVLGDSNVMWGALPLPLDLGGYIGASGCSLLTDPVVTMFTTTIGGGAGGGIGTISVNLPSITSYVGMSVFSQWFVSDPLANNGILAASAGLWTTVAGVGG
ncbi:MAG TPA: hypothetical protein VK348_11520, partial [Planctomycetota bacterium]|nr:hypothetical protein [Planctomycetota bacterium]